MFQGGNGGYRGRGSVGRPLHAGEAGWRRTCRTTERRHGRAERVVNSRQNLKAEPEAWRAGRAWATLSSRCELGGLEPSLVREEKCAEACEGGPSAHARRRVRNTEDARLPPHVRYMTGRVEPTCGDFEASPQASGDAMWVWVAVGASVGLCRSADAPPGGSGINWARHSEERVVLEPIT